MRERPRTKRAFRPKTDGLEKLAGASTLLLGVLTPSVLEALEVGPTAPDVTGRPDPARADALRPANRAAVETADWKPMPVTTTVAPRAAIRPLAQAAVVNPSRSADIPFRPGIIRPLGGSPKPTLTPAAASSPSGGGPSQVRGGGGGVAVGPMQPAGTGGTAGGQGANSDASPSATQAPAPVLINVGAPSHGGTGSASLSQTSLSASTVGSGAGHTSGSGAGSTSVSQTGSGSASGSASGSGSGSGSGTGTVVGSGSGSGTVPGSGWGSGSGTGAGSGSGSVPGPSSGSGSGTGPSSGSGSGTGPSSGSGTGTGPSSGSGSGPASGSGTGSGSGSGSGSGTGSNSNKDPIAVDDKASTIAQTPVTIDVMADPLDGKGKDTGDHDPDGDPLTITKVGSPQNGTATLVPIGNHTSDSPYWNDGSRDEVQYTPNKGFIGTDTFQYTISDGRGGSASATVTVTVNPPPIRSVQWVASTASPLDPNPGPGGGLRIYPDRDTGGTADRSWVYVRATLTVPVAGMTIYLMVRDVDDPSSNVAPVDNESNGFDNRGGNPANPPKVETATTDAKGQVQIPYKVPSMQPGDNYRVVASTSPFQPSDFTAMQNDGTRAGIRDNANGGARLTAGPAKSVMSDMLTVWRRLHVELASMGVVGVTSINGTMTVPTIPPGATSVTVTTDQSIAAADANRFDGGSLSDKNGNRYPVTSYTTGSSVSVTISLPAGTPAPASGMFFLNGNYVITTGTRLPMPDTSTLAPALASAYVTPVYDLPGNPNVPFSLNVDDLAGTIKANWASASQNANDYWVEFILEAYLGPKAHDGRPASEGSWVGVTVPSNGGSIIFEEMNAEDAAKTATPLTVYEGDTVVHEVGHDVGRSGAEPVTLYPASPSVYTQDYLNAIRSAQKPDP